MNDLAIPICLDLAGTLTPSNPRDERTLSDFKRARIDAQHLPLRQDLVAWLREQRARGRRVILVSEDSPALTAQLTELDLFDEIAQVEGDGSSAERKRRLLVRRFGERGFDYAGSAASDLPVWEVSHGAVVVGSRALSERVGRKAQVLQVFPVARPTVRTWIRAIRVHQWVKNALIFLPALLAHRIGQPAILLESALAFIAFGCCASSVYVTNDLFDLAADRQHPRKRLRPFAAGTLSVRAGIRAAIGLAAAAAGVAALVGWPFAVTLAAYYVLTWSYSLRLKRAALVDVMMLAGLYTLRIIAGCAATLIEPSFWLLAFSVFLFLSLGFVKRYAELDDARKAGKLTGKTRGYSAEDLPLILNLGTASGYCAVVVIALYINSADSTALYHHHKPLWLICPLMLYWVSRVWLLAARGQMHDDPVVFALRDRISLVVVALLGLIVLLSV